MSTSILQARLTQQANLRGGFGANSLPRRIVVTVAGASDADSLSKWATHIERVLGDTNDTLVVALDEKAMQICQQLSLPCFRWANTGTGHKKAFVAEVIIKV